MLWNDHNLESSWLPWLAISQSNQDIPPYIVSCYHVTYCKVKIFLTHFFREKLESCCLPRCYSKIFKSVYISIFAILTLVAMGYHHKFMGTNSYSQIYLPHHISLLHLKYMPHQCIVPTTSRQCVHCNLYC